MPESKNPPLSKDKYDSLLLRLRQFVWDECRVPGLTLVTMRVLVDNGDLLVWAEPNACRLESGRQGEDIIRALALMAGDLPAPGLDAEARR